MVLRETQRAFVYFTLHGLRSITSSSTASYLTSVQDNFFAAWHASQRATLAEIIRYFDPVPTKKVPLFAQEVLGYDRLRGMAERLYGAERRSIGRNARNAAILVRPRSGPLRSPHSTCLLP